MKHLFLICTLVLFTSAGCRIVVSDGSGGGGGSTAYDDGGSSSDSGYDDHGGGAEPEPEPAPRRAEPAPRRSEPRTRVVAGPKRYVGGYRSAYPNLPDLGKTQANVWANNGSAVDRGYLVGDLKAHGENGVIKVGAGAGETVVDGHLEIRGNNYVFRGMTITGNVDIRGNNNDISGCQVFGSAKVRGSGNKTP